MGIISYWMTDSLKKAERSTAQATPMTIEDVLRGTDLAIWRADERWVLSLQGFPREWHETEEEAREAADRWNRMEPSVEHTSGPTWLAFTGDQFVFTSTSKEEVENFVFGVAVGRFFEKTNPS
jgi:hypothetical protein